MKHRICPLIYYNCSDWTSIYNTLPEPGDMSYFANGIEFSIMNNQSLEMVTSKYGKHRVKLSSYKRLLGSQFK